MKVTIVVVVVVAAAAAVVVVVGRRRDNGNNTNATTNDDVKGLIIRSPKPRNNNPKRSNYPIIIYLNKNCTITTITQ